MAISYPVDVNNTQWAVFQISTAQVIARRQQWPRFDGGEIQDIIDNGEKSVPRKADIAEIFPLPPGQRAGKGTRQEFAEADDVGERCAKFI